MGVKDMRGFLTFLLMAICQLASAKGGTDSGRIRRHFIIAYDISPPFLHAMRKDPNFSAGFVERFAKAGTALFNPATDEISFYHFGIARGDFDTLRDDAAGNDQQKRFTHFCDHFLKDQHLSWKSYYARGKSVNEYFSAAFSLPAEPADFGEGVSLSNYVYPLILQEIPLQYAEDQVLIVISDFLTGSDFGNKNDFLRIQELYGYDDHSSPALIQAYTDSLNAAYYRVEDPVFTIASGNHKIGSLAFIIRPKIGRNRPESYSLFIDGNLELKQSAYGSAGFTLNTARLRFTHNAQFIPGTVSLRVTNPDGRPLFEGLLAGGGQPLQYDSMQQTYVLPRLDLTLPDLQTNSSDRSLMLEYQIDGTFAPTGSHMTGYTYVANRTLDDTQIHFISSTPRIMTYSVIAVLVILLLVWILVRWGRPREILLSITAYEDSYEYVVYKNEKRSSWQELDKGGELRNGRQQTPYKYWNEARSAQVGEIRISYATPGYWFNWRPRVRLSIEPTEVPQGFDIYLRKNPQSGEEFYPHHPLTIEMGGNGHKGKPFSLEIRQNGGFVPLDQPLRFEYNLVATSQQRKLFGLVDGSGQSKKACSLHIGPDLGSVWVGIDPGTTGSCIAAGERSENILLGAFGKDRELIADSKIIFDISRPYLADPSEDRIPPEYYKYGPHAAAEFGTDAVISFQSIKKLLGFKDRRTVKFSNGVCIEVTGKKLSSLLVHGLYQDYKQFVEKEGARSRDLLQDGEFQPRRAVVAIPNNFTATRIRDMLGCFDYLGQFKELRYIYEAEAIFFYYLYNYSANFFNGTDSRFTKETLLIFDMGGATINATIIRAWRSSDQLYQVDILCRLGYGIGGDTIDYCTARTISEHAAEFPSVRIDFPFGKLALLPVEQRLEYADTAIALQKMALNVKKTAIRNFYDTGKKNFLETVQLEDALSNLQRDLGQQRSRQTLDLDPEGPFYSLFKKGRTDFLHNPWFTRYLYDNVRDVVQDVLRMNKGEEIDRVIFSGRSCSFPMVRETVESVLKAAGIEARQFTLDIERSKTAVATGACWYGLNRNAVRLNNLKTNSSFGIQRREGGQQEDLKYIEFLRPSTPFANGEMNGTRFLEHGLDLKDSFRLDNLRVNFFQVMGSDVNKILSQHQTHKFSRIASIPIDLATKRIEMRVFETDLVECGVKLGNGDLIKVSGQVSDEEIADATEEHYYWIIQ